MSDKSINESKKYEETSQRQQLLGKVVLLIGNDTAVLQNLVTQLAQKGADVALLCWQMPLETARKIRESAQSVGRHLLLIEQSKRHEATYKQLMQTVTAELGKFDIFIDLSAQPKREPMANGNGHHTTLLQPNWQLRHVVLQEMR